ncbi:histidine kinase [Psychrobacillus sp. Sa2BUA9]|uniref:Histidine kinase n=1 Tax=Psychrobacillus faecigallinarum TaxID=2762235 RepID=A0ABR8R5M3_9BACI|nr:histidine kinase [Psychrobacillus faecigallinarum]MBD7943060.1 histidine kinase [Psychrobacillus faecigallinarum]
MKKNFGKALAILIVILIVIGTLAISIAAEIGILLLVGIDFERWSSLIWFIVVYGVVEFIVIMALDAFIELKANSHQKFHKYFGHMIVSFTLIMAISLFIETIYLPITGAVIFAIATATMYLLFSFGDKKEIHED